MVRAVLTHAEGSKYDDLPEARYHFPRSYLNAVERALGDWVVYYEPRRVEAGSDRAGGRQAYFAAARITGITRDAAHEDRFYAGIADYLPFAAPVPFREGGQYYESMLQRPDGGTSKGAFGRAVRNVPDPEFDAILTAGFSGVREELGSEDWADAEPVPGGFHDPATPFARPMIEALTRKPFRAAAFARQVKDAYGNTCAMTGLCIRNGGGKPEVQAAHIRPVAAGGPDSIRNGLALSGTAHWMFDRHLISVDGDGETILVAEDRLPAAAKGLLKSERRLHLPGAAFLRPHPSYLAHHRANFGG